MKKKLISILITLFVVCLSAFLFTACEDSPPDTPPSEEQGGSGISAEWEGQTTTGSVFKVEDGMITGVTDEGKKLTKIIIPSEINGNTITTIGDETFANCCALTSITIPSTINIVGAGIFRNCSKLVEIINNSTNITIEEGYAGAIAVSNCYANYVSILSIDDTGFITYLDGEDKILLGCDGTKTDITIPSDVTKIADSAFSCAGLTSEWYEVEVNINPTFWIGNILKPLNVYKCQKTNITSIVVPESVKEIGFGAFAGLEKLKTIKVDGLNELPICSFVWCKELQNVTLSNKIESIGQYAFFGCDKLPRKVDGALKYIKINSNDYFYLETTSVSGLNSVTNNGNCKFIGYEAFCNYSSLKPSGWDSDWNDGCIVVWDCKNNNNQIKNKKSAPWAFKVLKYF